MSRYGSGPSLYVTINGARALLRGVDAERAVLMTGAEGPLWSDNGRGWVVSSAKVPDLLAYCQVHHLLVVVSDITDEQAVAS